MTMTKRIDIDTKNSGGSCSNHLPKLRKPAHLLRFLPAFLFIPIWLTISLREDVLVESFRQYYPLSIVMVFGSLIAGSTPLGGGVVAFPVSVLSIKFTPSQGRDFSLMIQSCGMTAASFLVLMKRPYLARNYGSLLAKTFFFNVIGLICGIGATFHCDVHVYYISGLFCHNTRICREIPPLQDRRTTAITIF